MNEEEKTYKKLLDDLKNLPKIDAPKNFETKLLRKINSSKEEKKKSFWDKLLSPGKLAPAAVAIASAAIIFFVVDINSEKAEDPLNISPKLREDIVAIQSMDEIPVEQLKKSARDKEEPMDRNEGMIETKEVETPAPHNAVFEKRSEMKSKGVNQSLKDEIVSGKSDSDNLKSEETGNLGGSAAPSATTIAAELSKADSFEREMKRERDEIVNLPVVKSNEDNISKENINFMQRNLSTEEKKEVQQLKMKVQAEKGSKTQQNSNKLP